MTATRQDEGVSQYRETLTRHYNPIGTWEKKYAKPGFEVRTAPLKAIRKEGNPYFTDLIGFLHGNHIDFKVYENGEVWFLSPHGCKFGHILGQIAHTYHFSKEAR